MQGFSDVWAEGAFGLDDRAIYRLRHAADVVLACRGGARNPQQKSEGKNNGAREIMVGGQLSVKSVGVVIA